MTSKIIAYVSIAFATFILALILLGSIGYTCVSATSRTLVKSSQRQPFNWGLEINDWKQFNPNAIDRSPINQIRLFKFEKEFPREYLHSAMSPNSNNMHFGLVNRVYKHPSLHHVALSFRMDEFLLPQETLPLLAFVPENWEEDYKLVFGTKQYEDLLERFHKHNDLVDYIQNNVLDENFMPTIIRPSDEAVDVLEKEIVNYKQWSNSAVMRWLTHGREIFSKSDWCFLHYLARRNLYFAMRKHMHKYFIDPQIFFGKNHDIFMNYESMYAYRDRDYKTSNTEDD
jgi:hypothetical protein